MLAAALGVATAAVVTAFRERCPKVYPVEQVSSAPRQELVPEGDAVDLTRLPIPLHFSVDAAPYIAAGDKLAVVIRRSCAPLQTSLPSFAARTYSPRRAKRR